MHVHVVEWHVCLCACLCVCSTTPGVPPSVLAPFVPVAEYGVADNDVVKVVRVQYDVHHAEAHVRRLKEVLASPPYPPPAYARSAEGNHYPPPSSHYAVFPSLLPFSQ